MKEWNAIDLHMHTVSGVTRDKSQDQVNFKYKYLQEVAQKHQIKLMAVTNHNVIDFKNYILMKHLLKIQSSNILMGVELDTNMSVDIPIHIAVIFEESFKHNYEAMKEINKKTEEKTQNEKVYYTDEEIISILGKYNVLMIPHGNKDKGVFKYATREQIDEAIKKIREGFIRIFDSPSDWKLEEIKMYLREMNVQNLDEFGGVLFSDVRDWENYDARYRRFYMNAEPTFRGLLHSISNPVQRFKPYDEIRQNNNYISKIKFYKRNDNSRIEDGEITLSRGYNCVIGKSGSGKSLLLHLIKRELLREGENKNYEFSNNTEIEIFNEEGKKLNPGNINLGIGANLYDKIISATSTNDTADFYSIISLLNADFIKQEKFNKFKMEYNLRVKKYVELVNKINSEKEELIIDKNKLFNDIKRLNELKEIKIFDIESIIPKEGIFYTDVELENFKAYTKNIQELKEIIKIYKGKYKERIEKQIENLNKTMFIAEFEMLKINLDREKYLKKVSIINNTIERINYKKSTNAREKSNLMSNIPIEREKIVKLILDIHLNSVIRDNKDLSINIEYINSEKEINKNVIVIEYLPNETIINLNEKENALFNTNRKKMLLDKEKNYNMSSKKEAKDLIDRYIDKGVIVEDKEVLSENLNVNVQIKFDGQDVTEMNPGSIAKKYIELYFEEQIKNGKNDVVIFDQIENDVDKEFINEVIKKAIEETKGHVQLIIVTHDPIVAVNADPNNYIESIKNTNNKFCYRNFVAESYERDELETIAHNVDGAKEVIKGRYEIYEGEKLYGN